MPLIDTVTLLLIAALVSDPNPRLCHVVLAASSWAHVAGVIFSEIIMTLRIWAVCKIHIPRLKIFLFLSFILCYGTIITLKILFYKTSDPLSATSPTLLTPLELGLESKTNCFMLGGQSHLSSICYILHMSYQVVICVLTLIPGIPAYKQRKLFPMFNVIYRDGLSTDLIIVVTECLNLTSVVALPSGLAYLMMPMARVLHSILISHLILHIRYQARRGVVLYSRDGSLHIGSLSLSGEEEVPLEHEPITFRGIQGDRCSCSGVEI
ncbi:hypothetical protein VKT23_017966 [Stygiomarasmius scandens]|uniref:Vomeronasal type-1 receptor n=1 Tax=Marasmiellus scandens TaxID=2682957 RepID=A0ABR1IQP1_9AGAR